MHAFTSSRPSRTRFSYSCNHHQVLPSLRDQRDEKLLRELHRRWDNHNVMTRWLSRFFNYLDRCDLLSAHLRDLVCFAQDFL